MGWFEKNFQSILEQYSPEIVAYRFHLSPNKSQIEYMHYPFGVLNLICHHKGLKVVSFTPMAYKPSKLGLPKDADLYESCDLMFGNHPPYWNKQMKNAILAAWFGM